MSVRPRADLERLSERLRLDEIDVAALKDCL